MSDFPRLCATRGASHERVGLAISVTESVRVRWVDAVRNLTSLIQIQEAALRRRCEGMSAMAVSNLDEGPSFKKIQGPWTLISHGPFPSRAVGQRRRVRGKRILCHEKAGL